MNRTQLAQLAVLATVAEHRSFRAAAKELEIAPSAVSHAVSSLEESLGIRLLARTTRSVAPTEEGRLLLQRLKPALDEIGIALEAVSEAGGRPAGTLRVTAPRFASDILLAPRLGEFLNRYPDITLEIANEDGFIDIVREGFDAGIRLEESLEADMIAVRASPNLTTVIAASPDYFKRHAKPLHPSDLVNHRCLKRRFTNGTLYRWEFERAGQAATIDKAGPIILDDEELMVDAALKGLGIAYVASPAAETALAEGRLRRILAAWTPASERVAIYYPGHRAVPPALRAFLDVVKASRS